MFKLARNLKEFLFSHIPFFIFYGKLQKVMTETYNESQRPKMALLIDGDNARPTLLEKYISEAGKHGTVTMRRIYGDWTTPYMKGWKERLNNNAVQPIQQFRYTTGKNSTDSAMIIDAMDTLHSGLVNGFCIVSSDSDYTRLATRIRESGMFVMGIGESKTPKSFVNACNLFIYSENLLSTTSTSSSPSEKHDLNKVTINPIPILTEAYDLASGDDDWVRLSALGTQLRQLDPGFDPRSFGYRQLSYMIKGLSHKFEWRYENAEGPSAIYIKMKESP